MEAWGAMLQRRRDAEAESEGPSASARDADGSTAYDVRDVTVDVPLKKSQTLEALLASRAPAEAGGSAALVALGTSDGALHCYAFDKDHHSLCWLATHKRVFHAGATFLDSWGVFLTLTATDAKLALYALPLENSVPADGGATAALMKGINWGLGGGSGADSDRMLVVVDDAKHTSLFAAHERAKVVCCLSKQGTLRVFDWTVNRTLELRAQHELPVLLASAGAESALSPAALPALKLVVMGESHVFVHFKRAWCVLNVDSGKFLDVGAQYASAALSLDAIACAIAVPSRQTGLHHHSHQLQDVFVAGKHTAVVVALAVDNEDEEEATIVDDRMRANPQNVSDDRVRVKVERVLEYGAAPRAVFYHHPLLLLDHYDAIAVHNVGTMHVLQSIPTKSLYGGCAAVSIEGRLLEAATPSHASPNVFQDGAPATFFTAAAPFSLQLLTMKPIAELVKHATASNRLRDAVALCKLCPEDCNLSDEERHALFAERALELFQSGEYRKAMTLFLESELDIMDVLALYPRDLLPRSSGGDDARTSFVWKRRQQGAHKVLAGDALVQSLLALILLLRHKHDLLGRSSDGRFSAAASGNRAKLTATHSSSNVSDKSREVIDTVLLKCLVLICEKKEHAPSAKKELMELVSRPNQCEMGEAEIFLRAHRQFKALLGFYAARKEHRKALELLEDLERTAAANEKAAAAAAVSPSTTATSPADQDEDRLQTSEEYMVLITEYLQRLGLSKSELVFEFSRRVLAVKPALGLTIFTHRKVHEQKEDIDPASILSHLKTCELQSHGGADTEAGATSPDHGTSGSTPAYPKATTLPLIAPCFVAIEYLTQVIQAGRVTVAPRLHDEVVYLLLDAINTELHSGSKGIVTGLSTHATSATRLTSRVSSQRGLVGTLRKKLMEFLASESSAYHPERMLSRTPQEMVDERAALLSKLGRHHEVLQLYAIELKDASLAESYCNRCYDAKLADSSIYSALLRLYLRPLPSPLSASSVPPLVWQRSGGAHHSSGSGAPNASPFHSSEAVAAAVSLLNKYPERIDVPTALDLLPPDVPVASLAFFFRRVVECQVERFRNGQVKKQLSKMENFTVRQALAAKRKGSVTVWSSHCCQTCGKKLGTGTFVRLPSGALLHYSCQPSA